MQLTQFTDLGLRAVMRLAVADGERPSSRAIAEQLAVSYTHMTKVVTRLAELAAPPTRNVLLALPRLAHDTEVRARTIGV